MNCRGCGRPIPVESRFCPYCGHQIPGASDAAGLQTVKPPARDDTNIVLIVVVIVVAVALASFAAIWWVFSSIDDLPFNDPGIEDDLDLYYYIGGVYTHPRVSVEGTVYYYGDTGCYATVHCTIFDDRGWSITRTIELGWIGPNGGNTYVNVSYDWPEYYNGQSADGDSLYWTHYVTTSFTT
jgi:hypothetical protein